MHAQQPKRDRKREKKTDDARELRKVVLASQNHSGIYYFFLNVYSNLLSAYMTSPCTHSARLWIQIALPTQVKSPEDLRTPIIQV